MFQLITYTLLEHVPRKYVLHNKCRILRFSAGKYFKRGKLKTYEKETDIEIPA